MATASLSALGRKRVKGKRRISRRFVVSGNPTFKLCGIGVGESEAAHRELVDVVLAVTLGAIPFK
jgi:hypothetical protein